MKQTPFTISTDIDLGIRAKPYVTSESADVSIAEAPVPEHLENRTAGGISYDLTENEFLLRMPNGTRYLLRNGNEITYQRGSGVSDRDVVLFLLGSVWGALCYQRDLLPLHASGVIVGDSVFAFTGQSGAGKSTLSAALADKGLDFFTDDILVIDPAEISKQANCFAGQKDLKLWKSALKLTDAKQMAPIRDAEDFEKYFAIPSQTGDRTYGNLAGLFVLSSKQASESRDRVGIDDLSGGEALHQLLGSVYRPKFAEQIWGRKKLYQALGRLIAAINLYSFNRPFVEDDFGEGVAFLDNWIKKNSRNSLKSSDISTETIAG